jgi:hypothetical protein
VAIDGDRLERLREAKLRALCRGPWPDAAAGTSHSFPNGVALVAGTLAVVLVEGAPSRVLGGALLLATKHRCERLEIVIDPSATAGEPVDLGDAVGVTARRAALLRMPIGVWRVRAAELAAAVPAPLMNEASVPPGTERFEEMLATAGLEVVREHGLLLGECLGLEVARVEDGELRVGVGRFDREAAAVIWSDRPTEVALASVVHEVRKYRNAGAEPHPLNRLCRERWLRTELIADPALVGVGDLVPISLPEPRLNLRDPSPAPAVGVDDQGSRVLVMCSVGVDLELVPVAADLVAREAATRMIVVTPARDQLSFVVPMVALLAVPATFCAVEGNWPSSL